MTDFDRKKLAEILIYILEKTGGVDFYHAFKILYFAEMKHLAKWGTRIVPDNFCALKYGPVPTRLYDAVKKLGSPDSMLANEIDQAIYFAGDDAPNVLLPRRNCDLNFLSASEIDVLDESIAENVNKTFNELVCKSHDSAWHEAAQRLNGTNVISPVSMAKVMNVDDAVLEYIQEQLDIDAALS